MPERILILGGTREARQLAGELGSRGFSVVTSLAGVTENPMLPPGGVRRGGFGGVAGLIAYLAGERFCCVVDATHPFAAQMSAQAHAACQAAGLPLYRLGRPAWEQAPGDRWMSAATVEEAARILPRGARALVTIGRKEVAPFLSRLDISGVARMIEPAAVPAPPGWTVLLGRPPFTLASEESLMRAHAITHLVTKNAGGADTEQKLIAARRLQLPVVMVVRPPKPCVPCFAHESDLMALLLREHSP